MMMAAGIKITARSTGNILYLKRGSGGDHAGEWCFPGGKQEEGESLEECALRETKEELGFMPKIGPAILWTRSINARQISPPLPAPAAADLPMPVEGAVPASPISLLDEKVCFTTFRAFAEKEFMPKLDAEHVGYCWAPPGNPPEPLHPGCRIALDRLGMNELGIARAIADGRLTSPQKYENLWLFALRITGTGMAYRLALKEFVWRDPALYMTDEFLARCNGLPVIWQHPKKKPMMDSKEFADRCVGAIMLPYFKPDLEHPEVWGVAKILDDEAALAMIDEQMSTSPCVVFRGMGVNSKFRTEDGKVLLIEGDPQLLDHLAICPQGVWDKGGEPAGVQTDHHQHEEELIMADEDKKMEEKKDASGEKLDKILTGIDACMSGMDSMSKRMDAFEERADADRARMDAMEEKKDSKADGEKEEKAEDKKDSGENEKEKKEEAKEVVADKKDGADLEKEEDKKDAFDPKADSQEVRRMISDMEKRIVPRSDEERKLFSAVQERADEAFQMFGDSAKAPMDGETLMAYRRRLLGKMQIHSASFKDAKLELIQDVPSFDAIEKHIFADAMKAAMSPESIPADQLRSFKRKDVTGREITTFGGQPRAWMSNFGGTRRRLQSVRNA